MIPPEPLSVFVVVHVVEFPAGFRWSLVLLLQLLIAFFCFINSTITNGENRQILTFCKRYNSKLDLLSRLFHCSCDSHRKPSGCRWSKFWSFRPAAIPSNKRDKHPPCWSAFLVRFSGRLVGWFESFYHRAEMLDLSVLSPVSGKAAVPFLLQLKNVLMELKKLY